MRNATARPSVPMAVPVVTRPASRRAITSITSPAVELLYALYFYLT